MKRTILLLLAALMLGGIFAGVAIAADGQKLQITGVNYTKFLWGNRRYDGSMYNFTTIPGEGFGDNGQGTEIELLLNSKPSSKVEVTGRLKSRFNQNQWTNFGPVYIFGDSNGFQDINFYLDGTLIGTSEVEFFPLEQAGWTTNHDFDACSRVTTTPSTALPTITTSITNTQANNGGTTTITPASGIIIVTLGPLRPFFWSSSLEGFTMAHWAS